MATERLSTFEGTMRILATEYPQSTLNMLNGIPTCSAHGGIASYETYVVDQEESACVISLLLQATFWSSQLEVVHMIAIYSYIVYLYHYYQLFNDLVLTAKGTLRGTTRHVGAFLFFNKLLNEFIKVHKNEHFQKGNFTRNTLVLSTHIFWEFQRKEFSCHSLLKMG